MKSVQIPPRLRPMRHPPRLPLVFPARLDPSCRLALLPVAGESWHDYSGKGNDGVTTTAHLTCKSPWGFGWYTDGGDYLDCGVDDSLHPTDALTLACWVDSHWDETMTSGSNKYMLGFVYTDYALMYHYTTDKVVWFVNGNALEWPSPPNGRHHIVGTYDGALESLYVDGALIDTFEMSGAVAGSTNHFAVGHLLNSSGNPTGTRGFVGIYDQVILFARGLAADEIKALYEQWR
jgi:hypothetical protein